MKRALIVTALDLEFVAVCAHIHRTKTDVDRQGTYYTYGDFIGRRESWEVAVVQVGQGNTMASLLTGLAFEHVNPDILLMVGVAGGLKGDVDLGDVVAAPKVYGYEKGKETDEGFLPRPDVFNSAYRLVQVARQVAREALWPGRVVGMRGLPKALVQPIAAGEKVIASNRGPVRDFLVKQYSDAFAVEMEGLGFLAAAHVMEARALVIRGVSDHLSDKTMADAEAWQLRAAGHAAGFAFEILAELQLPRADQTEGIPAEPSMPSGLAPGHQKELKRIIEESPSVRDELTDFLRFPLEGAKERFADAINSPPSWLGSATPRVWGLMGALAELYESSADASIAYERAARAGMSMGWRWLARAAATAAIAGDRPRADVLMSEAEHLSPGDVFVATFAAALRSDPYTGVRLTDRTSIDEEEALVLDLYLASAKWHSGDQAGALALLSSLARRYPDRTGPRFFQAQFLLTRVQQGRPVDRLADLSRAVELSTEARDLTHAWGGNAARFIAIGSAAAIAADDADTALRLALPVNLGGEATAQEAAEPKVVAAAARAALQGNRKDIQLALADQMRGSYSGALTEALRLKQDLGASKPIEEALELALDLATDPAEIFAALFHLADIGAELPVDKLAHLQQVEPELGDMVQARVDAVAGRLDEAKERLRHWSGTSPDAARALGHVHALGGDIGGAVEVFRDAAARFGMTTILLDAVEVAMQGSQFELAERTAEEAIQRLPTEHPGRTHALTRLVELSGRRHAWRLTEERAILLRRSGDSDWARWALAAALFNQVKLQEAWNVVADEPPLEPRNADDARMKVMLLAEAAPPDRAMREALEIAESFPDSEGVVGVVLQTVAFLRVEEDVAEELKGRGAAVADAFFNRFPNSRLFQRIPISGPGDVLEYARQQLEAGSDEMRKLERAVRFGEMPYGLLAAATGRPYAETIVTRLGAGFLVAAPRSKEEKVQGEAAAEGALGGAVIADTSAFAVTGLLADGWEVLSAKFHRVSVADVAVRDAFNARRAASAKPVMVIALDPRTHQAIPVPISREHAEQVAKETVELAERMASADQLQCSALAAFPDLEDPDRSMHWLSSIQVAIDHPAPLWSDDSVQRQLARELGIPTFGSVDLINVLTRQRRLTEERAASWRKALIEGRVGDFVQDIELLVQVAEAGGWVPGPASAGLGRPAIWMDHVRAHATFLNIFQRVAKDSPDLLPHWLFVATSGAAARLPASGHLLSAVLLSVAIVVRRFDASSVPELVAAARAACSDVEAPDPLPATTQKMFETATQMLGAQSGAILTVGAFAHMPEQDRATVRSIVFPSKV